MANLNKPVFEFPKLAFHQALESSAVVNNHESYKYRLDAFMAIQLRLCATNHNAARFGYASGVVHGMTIQLDARNSAGIVWLRSRTGGLPSAESSEAIAAFWS